MCSHDRKGVTLIESLISIFLLSVLLVSILGAFFISRLGAVHAKHRLTAMNIIREYTEYEMKFGYEGINDGDGFANPLIASADPIPVTIDDRGTADAGDDLIGTITPEPYFPLNLEDADGNLLSYPETGFNYKVIGFLAQWTEDFYGAGPGVACAERAAVYVARHDE